MIDVRVGDLIIYNDSPGYIKQTFRNIVVVQYINKEMMNKAFKRTPNVTVTDEIKIRDCYDKNQLVFFYSTLVEEIKRKSCFHLSVKK